MKKLKHSLAARVTAAVLFVLCLGAALGGAVCTAWMADDGYYNAGGLSFYDTSACRQVTEKLARTVYYDYLYYMRADKLTVEDSWNLKRLEETFKQENTNFFFTVTDTDGSAVLTNFVEQEYGFYAPFSFSDGESRYDREYVVNAYVKDPITAKDNYYAQYRLFSTLYAMRFAIIALTVLAALMTIVLFSFLMWSAGYRKGGEEVVLRTADRIPLDVLAAAVTAVTAWILISVGDNLYFGGAADVIAMCALVSAASVPALFLCMTFAVRVRAGRWWENTAVFRLLRLALKLLRSAGTACLTILRNLPLLWKTILAFGAFALINFITFIIFMDSGGQGFFFMLGLLFNAAVLTGVCYIVLQLDKLRRGGARIAGGDYAYKIETHGMFPDIKAHAESLNNIGAGMSGAVEERLRSERLKTELITNVSHDIKTPLTSIVNYVDLLKKENLVSDNAREYVAVLDRQSQRLKKLTEDLVEASKASTGNIAMSPGRTDITELLGQCVGEYAGRFEQCRLVPVVKTPHGGAAVMADGRLLWRVFDNLLSNVCKYSQPDTRVYFDVTEEGGRVVTAVKNISRYQLNIPTDELLERFVRGDSARTTEGSGLGLSIARSLTELMKGSFDLKVDGDLFKVTIVFGSAG